MPGAVWNDTGGNPINAHGGGLLYHNGRYYWYGEYKQGETILPEWATWECYRTDVTGVGCYSSPDMVNWTFEGIVLPAEKDDPSSDLHPSKVLERPKVVYNQKTGKFVMWAHVESADYSKAAAGVAVADTPTGPFTYLGSFRPNNAMSRDQTVFVDDNGRAYQLYSSEENDHTLHQRTHRRLPAPVRPVRAPIHRQKARSPGRIQTRRQILSPLIRLHRLGPQPGRTRRG